MHRIYESTMKLIDHLRSCEYDESVIYPLDPSFPQFDLASKQMTGCGGLLTLSIKASTIEQMNAFANALSVFKMAVSWGGAESLILPMSVLYGLQGRADPEVKWNVARLSIGLEDVECLIEDLNQGARAVGL
jgi:cystathionine beta-lyase/cystathionine gamma-synthase